VNDEIALSEFDGQQDSFEENSFGGISFGGISRPALRPWSTPPGPPRSERGLGAPRVDRSYSEPLSGVVEGTGENVRPGIHRIFAFRAIDHVDGDKQANQPHRVRRGITSAVALVSMCAMGLPALAVMPNRAAAPSRPGVALPSHAVSQSERTSLSAAIGARVRAYDVQRTASGFVARGGGLTAHLGRTLDAIDSRHTSLSFSDVGLGRGTATQWTSVTSDDANANRVTYLRGALREWYSAGPLGIEQGFTITHRPTGVGQLVVTLPYRGVLRARLDGSTLQFLNARGQVAIDYAGLTAIDARGRRLPVQLGLLARRVLLRVDDANADYPIRIDPLIETVISVIPGDETGGSGFGASVALSTSGNIAVVGGPYDDNGLGAAWIYEQSGGGAGSWFETAKLTAPTSGPDAQIANSYAEADGGGFGWSVALNGAGTEAVIGSFADDNYAGAAWVYTNADSTWSEQAELLAPTTGPDASIGPIPAFGVSVALSSDGTTALIGGEGDGFVGPGDETVGAAWVFTESSSVWSEQAKLTAPTTGLDTESGGGQFGFSVALAGPSSALTALIGAPDDSDSVGAAWVYTGSGSSWSEVDKLTAPTTGGDAELGDASFGNAVALSSSGDVALIGGPNDGSADADDGAAWVFSNGGTGWAEQAKLTAPTSGTDTAAAGGGIGWDVAFSSNGTIALLGANDQGSDAGAAWEFQSSGASWNELDELTGANDSGDSTASSWNSGVALSSDGQTALYGTGDNEDTGEVSIAEPVLFSSPALLYGVLSAGDSATETLTVSNGGAAALDIGTLLVEGTQGSSFTIVDDGCSGQDLPVGGACEVSVTFEPVDPGADTAYYANLEVPDNLSSSPQLVPLIGNGALPSIAFSPSPVAFGSDSESVPSGTTVSQNLTISNPDNLLPGPGELHLGALELSGAQSSSFSLSDDTCSNQTLGPGQTCTVSVSFSPSTSGTYYAMVSVADNAASSPQSVQLTGVSGSSPVTATATPGSLSFSTESTQDVTVTNTSGSGALFVGTPTISGTNAANFSERSDCTASVAPGDSCTIAVSYRVAAGTHTAELQIPDDSTTSPHDVSLTGVGGLQDIVGFVYDGAGTSPVPLAGASIRACPFADPSSPSCVGIVTAADGSFDVPGLFPGSEWALETDPPVSSSAPDASSLSPADANVIVGLTGPVTQDFTLSPATPLSGGLSFDGQTSGVPVFGYNEPFNYSVPLKIPLTGTPNGTLLFSGFTATIEGAESANPADVTYQAAMILFAAHYNASGKINDVSPPELFPINCESSAAQLAGCANMSGIPTGGGGGGDGDSASLSAHAQPRLIDDLGCAPPPGLKPTKVEYGKNANGEVTRTSTWADGSSRTEVLMPQLQLPNFQGSHPWANTAVNTANAAINATPAGWYNTFSGSTNAAINFGSAGSAPSSSWTSPSWQVSSQLLGSKLHGPVAVLYNLATGYVTSELNASQPTTVTTSTFSTGCAVAYADPSGTVRSTTGIPLEDATVTLRRSETASGRLSVVPNGSAIMSPANRRNPSRTNALGGYGWDVVPGYYEIAAEHTGCKSMHASSAVSPLLPVPPAQTGVNLELTCPGLHQSPIAMTVILAHGKGHFSQYDLEAKLVGSSASKPQGVVTFYEKGKEVGSVLVTPSSGDAILTLGSAPKDMKVEYSGDYYYEPVTMRIVDFSATSESVVAHRTSSVSPLSIRSSGRGWRIVSDGPMAVEMK
jgi:hypothetical protein